MARNALFVAKAIQAALHEGLELHLDGIIDPSVRSAEIRATCGRIADYLVSAPLPIADDELAAHRALIAATLQAAERQLRANMVDA
ncbi:hypothetical protein [Muricoccus aerilatus]|uniref:hypothetical protein n=1 Tax=Muricoccus aerilatus TaxID=452982 RepID=UPI0005C1A9D1|nr:hypothetical protein [Roseomonas aerilata]